jgi:hypothetical protein
MDFGFISTQVLDIFLYLSAPLALVIFDNHSIRKHVSWKSKSFKSKTFSMCFVGFVPSLFFWDFLWLLMPCGVPFGTNFEKKKTFRKSLPKKRVPLYQTADYDHGPRLPDSPPHVRTSQTRNKSSSSKCCSNSCPCLWFRKIDRKWLFGLASIANFSKTKSGKWKRADVLPRGLRPLWSDTPWAKARRIVMWSHGFNHFQVIKQVLASAVPYQALRSGKHGRKKTRWRW